MKNLSEMLVGGNIDLDIEARDFNACLTELTHNLIAQNMLSAEQGRKLDKALLSRERLVVTSIGRGVVIPHAYMKEIPRDLVCFARLKQAVAHEAPDGHPVDLIFLLSGPEEAQNRHLKMLAHIIRLLNDRRLLEELRQAATAEEVLQAIRNAERRHV